MSVRILIAEDHLMFAELCKRFLEPEFNVIGIVDNGQAMVREALKSRPNVILVDVSMPILNGLDAGQQVKKVCPAIKLIYLTANADPELAAEAFRRGGSGYIVKSCAASELPIAVREVLRGKSYLSSNISRDRVDFLRLEHSCDVQLSPRQREVLQLLVEGKQMKEVGSILKMTTRTVAFHKYRMMEQLGAKNNVDLFRYAVRNKMIAA